MLYPDRGWFFGKAEGWAVAYRRSKRGRQVAAEDVNYAVERGQVGCLGELEVERDPPRWWEVGYFCYCPVLQCYSHYLFRHQGCYATYFMFCFKSTPGTREKKMPFLFQLSRFPPIRHPQPVFGPADFGFTVLLPSVPIVPDPTLE